MASRTKVSPQPSEGLSYSESMYASAERAPDPLIPAHYGKVTVAWIAPACFGYACQRREKPHLVGGGTPDDPEQDQGNSDVIGVDAFFMTYHEADGRPMASLQQSFEEKFALLHLQSMRWGAFGGTIMLSLYGGYDYFHYADTYPELMGTIFALRYAGMVPMLLLSGMFTFTKQYNQPKIRQVFLAVSTGILGTMIIAYSYITMAATQGTFALFFTMLFFLVPLGLPQASSWVLHCGWATCPACSSRAKTTSLKSLRRSLTGTFCRIGRRCFSPSRFTRLCGTSS